MRRTGKAIATLSAALSLALMGGGVAFADIVTNNVASTAAGKVLSVQAGGSATVAYSIQNENRNDGDTLQNNCNPADGSAVTITALGAPAGVTSNQPAASACATDVASITFTVPAATEPGDYAITHTFTDTGAGRYLDQGAFTLRITAPAKQNQTISFAEPASPQSYGSTFSVAPTATSGLTVSVGATGACSISGSTVRMTGSTGDCTLTANQAGSDSFNAAPTVIRTVAAAMRPVTGSFTAENKTYDGSASATVLSRALTGQLTADDVLLTGGTAAFSDAVAGSGKTVTLTGATLGGATAVHYALTSVGTTTANIAQRPVTVTADAKGKTFGDADPALTFQATGLLGSDEATGALTREAGEDAGTYAIQQGTVAVSANYALTYVPANLVIGQKSVTVTADPQTKTYGDADPELSYTAGDLNGNDAFTGVLARDAGEDVSSYAITQGSLTAGPNYAISFTGAQLEITQRAITVTADAAEKVYGDADPTFTAGVTTGNLVGDDTLSGALTRDPGKDVGAYAIRQGALTAGGNYSLSFVPADLTISPKALTVTADDASKTYGDTDPALTFTVPTGGLVNDDTASVFTGGLQRAPGVGVGTYAITSNDLSAGDNYTLTVTPGTFTINAKPLSVTADAKSKTYGEDDPELTFTAGTLVDGDEITGSLTRAPGENVGTRAISQGTVTAGDNYSITFTPANLTITQRPITVTADPKSKAFGAADPALTHSVTSGNLVGTDALTGSLARAAGEAVGVYAINQGSLTAGGNYALTYRGANLTIAAWTLKGFFSPIGEANSFRTAPGAPAPTAAPSTVWQTAKGGSTIPLKFEVFHGATESTDVQDIASFLSVKLGGCTGTTSDPVDELASAGSSSLRYDTADGQFIQNWKTPTGAGKCLKAIVTTVDGSSQSVLVKLK